MDSQATKSLFQLIEATWTDVRTTMSEQDADRIDWLRLIRSWRNTGTGMLKLPFAVVLWGKAVEASGGGIANQEWDLPVTVALVVSIGSAEKTENFLMTRMETMHTALLACTMSTNNFQVLKLPSRDYSAMSQANEVFNRANLPFQAGEISFVMRYGVTP